jgi:dimethylargininase
LKALVRPTSRRLAEGQLTHIDRVSVDVDLAERQWAEYCLALDNWGFQTVPVAGDDALPDSVFVEDAVVVFEDLAVLTSPGAESRRAETDAVGDTLRGLGIEVATIDLPGTLDGGDVLKIDRTVYVGQGGRTNGDGIRQLRALLTPRGYRVVGVPVTKVLHLKSGVTALPDGTVVGHPDDVDHPEVFERFLPMPEHGAAVVVLDAGTVLMAASVPASIALIERLGYRVITVDISEFEKLEGCVTCLSVRLRS